MKKPLPKFKNDDDFIKFFETHDLGDYLESKDLIRPQFELRKKDRLITLRISSALLTVLKTAAGKHKTRYQKLIRSILEENILRYI